MMTLHQNDFASIPVQIEELPSELRFSLRCRAEHRVELAAALSLELPPRIGERAGFAKGEALCLGPDEWLVLAHEASVLKDAADQAYAAIPHSMTEISDREITLHLTGPKVLDLLATGCPRNIEALAVGRAVRTVFDSATVILWRDGPENFRLDVWRSFLPHVRALLKLAEAELRIGL